MADKKSGNQRGIIIDTPKESRGEETKLLKQSAKATVPK